jgi:hypothetical protein
MHNHVVTSFFTSVFTRLLPSQPDVSLNAITYGNHWKQGLGCELDGLQLHSSDFPSPLTQHLWIILKHMHLLQVHGAKVKVSNKHTDELPIFLIMHIAINSDMQ